jgi:hypothetical protein
MAVVAGLVIGLVAALFDNPVVPTGIAAAIGGFVGRLCFYSSRNRKALNASKSEPGEPQSLD